MKYCNRCLYPANHPLYITFDDNGVCSGCRVHEEKDSLDWSERLNLLKNIVKNYKATTRTIHDCIVPVSGARDSHFIVHIVKNVLGLNPLLVSYNKQYNTPTGIRNLAYLRSLIGADIMTMTVSPERVKRITKATIEHLGSMYWHCLAGQTAFPVQVAVKFKIPLIIWGAHQGVDQVGMYSHTDEIEMTRKYRKEHDLMGVEADDLLKLSDTLQAQDLEQYMYPHDKEIATVGVRGIYLNNYIRWDTKAQHELMIDKYNYRTLSLQRTFDNYNDVDCFHYAGLHDYIKYLKHGYGKATDHATREIRLKRLTREEGIKLASQYQEITPKDVGMFLDWVGMSAKELFAKLENHRNLDVWNCDDGEWKLKFSPESNDRSAIDNARLNKIDGCSFRTNDIPRQVNRIQEDNSKLNTAEITKSTANLNQVKIDAEDKYILIGRGWED